MKINLKKGPHSLHMGTLRNLDRLGPSLNGKRVLLLRQTETMSDFVVVLIDDTDSDKKIGDIITVRVTEVQIG